MKKYSDCENDKGCSICSLSHYGKDCHNISIIGGNIKMYRLKENLTQTQLAKIIDETQKDVSRWESGERNPKTDKLIKIAAALNCSIEDLIE